MLRRVLPVLLVFGAALALFLVLQQGNDGQETPGAAASSSSPSAAVGRAVGGGDRADRVAVTGRRTARADGGVAGGRAGVRPHADGLRRGLRRPGRVVRRCLDPGDRRPPAGDLGPWARRARPASRRRCSPSSWSTAPGAALDLNAVVVQAVYGGDRVQASPLYDAETVDLGGSLAPGGTATAVYSFAVPANQVGNVVLSVDVDGYRFPAVFSGAVPVG